VQKNVLWDAFEKCRCFLRENCGINNEFLLTWALLIGQKLIISLYQLFVLRNDVHYILATKCTCTVHSTDRYTSRISTIRTYLCTLFWYNYIGCVWNTQYWKQFLYSSYVHHQKCNIKYESRSWSYWKIARFGQFQAKLDHISLMELKKWIVQFRPQKRIAWSCQ